MVRDKVRDKVDLVLAGSNYFDSEALDEYGRRLGLAFLKSPDLFEQIVNDMEALGYVREADPENNPPDLVLLASAVGTESTEWFYSGWWGYWGWYPGWGYYPPGWGPGWGWGARGKIGS